MKRLLKGGIVVNGEESRPLDVLIDGETIEAVGEDLPCEGAVVVDVSGKLLFPGFIDAHTHMALEVSQTITADRFDTGTKAELAGGTTCILDFATQYPGESLADALRNWHKKADGEASCDYAFHLALSEWNEDLSREAERIVREEISSFKLYMTYDNRVDDETMYAVLKRLKKLHGLVGVHCENHGIIQARLAEVGRRKEGRRHVSDYPWTRPPEAEAEAVSRLLRIAKCVDTPVMVVHLSTEAGYREIQRAREAGQKVYVETCPQYLLLHEEKYFLPPERARAYMIAPPLRKKEDSQVLWEALARGTIQTVSTDHCSFTREQKDAGDGDFAKTPCGMPGAEERPALLWQFGVRGGKITQEQMCRYLSENPAKLYHLYPGKGAIRVGSDADIVVWDPEAVWTMEAKNQQSASGFCPMEGTEIRGRASQVYLRGVLSAENGRILVEKRGRYVAHGTELGETEKAKPEKKAVVFCSGACRRKEELSLHGFAGDCAEALISYLDGIGTCQWGCLGLGSCAAVCPSGAVKVAQGKATKIYGDKCIGCGRCVKACPQQLIHLVPTALNIYPGCVNEDAGAQVRESCDVGCIACGLCVRNCPADAIRIENNHPVIDERRCIACGMCAVKCPRGAIRDRDGIMDVR